MIPDNIKKYMGKIIIDEDFIIFRPKFGYRINANVIIIKLSETSGVLLDAPPIKGINPKLIGNFLATKGYGENYIKKLIITHGHQDHFASLKEYQKIFPKVPILVHKSDLNIVKYPYILPKSWKLGLKQIGYTTGEISFYTLLYLFFSHVYFGTIQITNKIDYIIDTGGIIKVDGNKQDRIEIIPTPGHSLGHISLIDNHKNLYVGDLVPFTPWICPIPGSLELMIQSLEKIIHLGSYRVKRIIKSHGDIRLKPHTSWEISDYENEREKYVFFLDSIYSTLDKIPSVLEGKEMNLHEICQIFNPNYIKYSKIMTRLFIPPAVSWALAYTSELERQGIIKRIRNKRNPTFTA